MNDVMMDILSRKIKYIMEQQNKKKNDEESQPIEDNTELPQENQPDENIPENSENSMTPENETENMPSDDEANEQPESNMDSPDMGNPGEMDDPNAGPSLEQIGRVYELKQLYNRLVSIRNHVSIFVEDEFDNIKKILSKAIDLFDLVINNYSQYEDRIDLIIVMYYNLINEIYEEVKTKYKKYSKSNDGKNSPFETNMDYKFNLDKK